MFISDAYLLSVFGRGEFTTVYRGKHLISKAGLIDYLVATTDDEPVWEKRLKGRTRRDK